MFLFIACSTADMSELPARLIDWFHVLKTNEKAKEMEDQHMEGEPVMIEENFTNEKMRAMCKFALLLLPLSNFKTCWCLCAAWAVAFRHFSPYSVEAPIKCW